MEAIGNDLYGNGGDKENEIDGDKKMKNLLKVLFLKIYWDRLFELSH